MSTHFLTVQRTKPSVRPRPVADPNPNPLPWHEKKAHVFYEIDSFAVAERLLELFQDKQKPEKTQQGEENVMAKAITKMVYPGATDWPMPIFALVNGEELDLTQRVLFREEVDRLRTKPPGYKLVLADMASVKMMLDKKTEVDLLKFYRQAQRWESLIRDELGPSNAVPETPSVSKPVGEKVAQASTMELPWADDAPEYLLLSQAQKLIDNRFSLQTLGRLCKPDGRIRYMRKGRRRRVHVADFLQYMKGQQSNPKWAAAYMNWLQGQKAGKTRLFWKCRDAACAHEYPEDHNATDRCPKCKGESTLTLKVAPKLLQ